MNSVVTTQDAKADHSKTKTKMKIPKIFNSIVAKMSKLTVDAVPVKKSDLTVATSTSSTAENTIEENRATSLDPWQSVSSEQLERPSSTGLEISYRQPSPLLISPNANHLALHSTSNNSLAVTNVGVQNNITVSNSTGLHFGNKNVYKIEAITNGIPNGGPQRAGSSPNAPRITKTVGIKELLKSTDSLDERVGLKMMRILSKYMDASWRFTLRELGFTDAEIDQKCCAFVNLKDGVFEIIYQSLLEWSRKQDDPTVGQLCTFLWRHQQKECVMQLENHLNRERTRNASESLSTGENGTESETSEKSMENTVL